MNAASAAAQTAARILVVGAILAVSACAPAAARSRQRPRPHTFCVPVVSEGVGMVRICGIPIRARR